MIVLDTHALVWWATGDSMLSKKAKLAIDREQDGGEIVVSSISAWEICMLVKRGKLILALEVSRWLATVTEIDAIRFHPVDMEIASNSVDLPGNFHKDQADRMIVATARKFAAPLVTKDEKIRAYTQVKTIW